MQLEMYKTGYEKIVYTSRRFQQGIIVNAFIWDPNLIKSGPHTFIELEGGLYYLNYNFDKYGKYILLIQENDNPVKMATVKVSALELGRRAGGGLGMG